MVYQKYLKLMLDILGTTYIRSLYGFNEVEYILEYILNNKEISF